MSLKLFLPLQVISPVFCCSYLQLFSQCGQFQIETQPNELIPFCCKAMLTKACKCESTNLLILFLQPGKLGNFLSEFVSLPVMQLWAFPALSECFSRQHFFCPYPKDVPTYNYPSPWEDAHTWCRHFVRNIFTCFLQAISNKTQRCGRHLGCLFFENYS